MVLTDLQSGIEHLRDLFADCDGAIRGKLVARLMGLPDDGFQKLKVAWEAVLGEPLEEKAVLEEALLGPRQYKDAFIELLKDGNITKPEKRVISAIVSRCPSRMMVISDVDDAVALYRDMQLAPATSTAAELLVQHGLHVNGPLFPNPGDGSVSLLTACDDQGSLYVVKLLEQSISGRQEAEACRVLCSGKPKGVPLVDVAVLALELGPQHSSLAGRGPGSYMVLRMSRYMSSLAKMVSVPRPALLAGVKRMMEALEWIHSKGYVHMDVKADNIFLDGKGRWWLGDFGSAVRQGMPATSTTTLHAPSRVLGAAVKQVDWHMLAVAMVIEVVRGRGEDWMELLVENGCTPRTKLEAAVNGLSIRPFTADDDLLARLLESLLERAAGGGVV